MKQNGELSLPPIDEILKNKYSIVSIIGPHADETPPQILARKMKEIGDVGESFWSHHSWEATPKFVQYFYGKAKSENEEVYCIFIEASSKTAAKDPDPNMNREHSDGDRELWATHYSKDDIDFSHRIPDKIKTGGKRKAYALILANLESYNNEDPIDLWSYSMMSSKNLEEVPIKFGKGVSAACCIKNPTDIGMKSRMRKIVAVAKLKAPFCVWVKRNS